MTKAICKACDMEFCIASMARHNRLYHPLLAKTLKPKERYHTIPEVPKSENFDYEIKKFSELKVYGDFDYRVKCVYFVADKSRTQAQETSISKFVHEEKFQAFLKSTIKRKGKNAELAKKVLAIITALIKAKAIRGDKIHDCPICMEEKEDHQCGTFFKFDNTPCSAETHRVCEQCYNLLHTCCPICRAKGYFIQFAEPGAI
jgi:hypothetical protein